MVGNLMAEVYGSQMRIRDLAGITLPEPRMLVITPWDASSLHAIEKAIQKSSIGINPMIHGKTIRVILPELSTERRQEMVKMAHKMAEDGRVAIRHVRRDAMELLRKAKTAGLAEDQEKAAEKEIQKLTDQYIGKIDE